MQLIATTLFALLGAASALPSRSIQARDGNTITFYSEANFGGEATVLSDIPSNECQQVAEGTTIGSVKVATGALCRLTYSAPTCTPHGDLFVYPDTPAADLTGETVTSFLCQACSQC